ncbi:MAG: phosphate signaling complex protein PhoU [Anaerolineae bacterium]|nr:phosphate signaling complex protein PhoU [Anaerolineae bacterium]
MPRKAFARELQRLEDDLLALGSVVEEALLETADVLKRQDLFGARRLIAQDHYINGRRLAIESEALTLIAIQQPMAGDLRLIAAVLDISSELERIGDYAKGIARITLMQGNAPPLKPLAHILPMARKAASMLHRALEAFALRDAERARALSLEDDEVDELYNLVYREAMACILANPAIADRANQLLWAAHNLERAADRVTNICERVIFTVTGEMVELDTKVE